MSAEVALPLVLAVIICLRAGYELYRLIFDVETLRAEFRQRAEKLPPGSSGPVGQPFLITSTTGLWLQRVIMAMLVAGSIAFVVIVLTNCKCFF